MSFDLHGYLRKKVFDVGDDYVNDLKAITPEQLNTSPGGSARIAYDYTFEVAYVNRRVATRLRGETPEAFPEGWMVAPEDLRVKDRAIDNLAASITEVIAAWDALPASEMDREIALPNGNSTNPIDLMFLVCDHTRYHDAQLNYLQAQLGDMDVHWQQGM